MIVARIVFQAKHGQAGALAQAVKTGMPTTTSGPIEPHCWRLMTDLSGPWDTVVLEIEAENLADWERSHDQLFASPQFQQQMRSSAQFIEAGRHEFYTIEARG